MAGRVGDCGCMAGLFGVSKIAGASAVLVVAVGVCEIVGGCVLVTPVELRVLPAPKVAAMDVVAQPKLASTTSPNISQVPVQTLVSRSGDVFPRREAKPRIFGELLVLWMLGMTIGIAWIFRQWWQTRRLVLLSERCGNERIGLDVAELADGFGIGRVPELRLAEVASPLLAGLLKPVILLPPAFREEKSPTQLRMMIAHELAHIKRRDLAWEWLTAIARVVFFFHPLVIVAARENRLAAEMAADELVVTVSGLERVDYAGMLVEVAARIVTPQRRELVVGIVGSHRNLKRRLEAMKFVQRRSSRSLTVAAIVVVVGGAAAIVPWRVVAQSPKAENQRDTPNLALTWTPGVDPKTGTPAAARSAADVFVDAKGRYHCNGRVVEAGELLSELKKSAEDPEFKVTIEADSKAPLHKLAALLDKLDKSGIKRFSLRMATSLEPQVFDIDFGIWRPEASKQTGAAAAGSDGDFWNTVGVAWSNDHTESGLKFANGEASPIQVRMKNLGGGWGSDGRLGIKSAMMNGYNYPQNNQGGNAEVILSRVPAGTYDIYIYGHEAAPEAYGDYTLTVGDHAYGRKVTSNKSDAIENTNWVEGSQYVKFCRVVIGANDAVDILIKPGGQVTDGFGRTFTDATINGLQLVPVP